MYIIYPYIKWWYSIYQKQYNLLIISIGLYVIIEAY